MVKRFARIACVLVVAGLTSQACIYGKRRGTGTNLGSGFGSDDDGLPPPGRPQVTEPQP